MPETREWWFVKLDELEAELQAAQELLLECHGWMAGIDPKPAPPFLDAVLAAAQPTEEPNEITCPECKGEGDLGSGYICPSCGGRG